MVKQGPDYPGGGLREVWWFVGHGRELSPISARDDGARGDCRGQAETSGNAHKPDAQGALRTVQENYPMLMATMAQDGSARGDKTRDGLSISLQP